MKSYMVKPYPARALYSVVVVAAVIAALLDVASSGSGGGVRTKVTFVVPAAAGSGYDAVAREAQQGLRANGIVNNVQVVNIPGASGTIGLTEVAEMRGRTDTVLMVGFAMVGGVEITNSRYTLNDITPIARLTNDYPVLILPADSPYQTLDEFLAAWRTNPAGHPIAGGALGNLEHLMTIMLAQRAGIDPKQVNYVSYSGGGEVLASLMSGTSVAGVSGYSELSDQIAAGRVRAIGVSAADPVPGTAVPTFTEQGIDLVASNWRGFVAPPDISAEAEAELVSIATDLHATPEWADALERNHWEDSFVTGQDFRDFIDSQVTQVRALMSELAL